jgi:D-alanyl-D-alanine carboxypeptidase (penicillin-binding protein 5/6)
MEVHKARYVYNQQLRPKKQSKWPFVTAILLLLLLLVGVYVGFTLRQKVPPLTAVVFDAPVLAAEPVSLYWPKEGQAAVGSLSAGPLAVNDNTPKPIASMTKLITALAVLEKAPLTVVTEQGVNYTYTAEDEAAYRAYLAKGGSVLPVNVGGTISQRQALDALLVVSANNIADMLVRAHFGTVEQYIIYANDMVKRLGLLDTVVDDASGFSAQTVSTPSDMIVVAQKVLAQPVLAAIVAQPEITLPAIGVVKNTNRLLVEPGIIGLKTGLTDEAGYCLLLASKKQISTTYEETVIVVLMGQKTTTKLYDEAKQVLNGAYPNFAERIVAPKGYVVGDIKSAWSERSLLITQDDLYATGWKGSEIKTTAVLQQNELTSVEANQPVGTLTLAVQNQETSIVAQSLIDPPKLIWRLLHAFKN